MPARRRCSSSSGSSAASTTTLPVRSICRPHHSPPCKHGGAELKRQVALAGAAVAVERGHCAGGHPFQDQPFALFDGLPVPIGYVE